MFEIVSTQNEILKECIKERTPVTIFFMNGFQLRGIITNFNMNVIVCEADGKQQMIYKHAISTIVPFRPLKSMATLGVNAAQEE